MTVGTQTRIIPLGTILIGDRQRAEGEQHNIEELSDSIMTYGLLHPIIVRKPTDDGVHHLVAGWRRLQAWTKLSDMSLTPYTKGIPARFISDLSPMELYAVELEENIQRKNLDWQDEAKAYATYYDMQAAALVNEEGPDAEEPSYAYVAGKLGVSERQARRMTVVGRKVKEGDPEVTACDSSRAAGALLDRRMKRAADIELTTFGEVEVGATVVPPDLDISVEDLANAGPGAIIHLDKGEAPQEYTILKEDFNEWVRGDAPLAHKYNFVHCDFPYGKGLSESDLMNVAARDGKLQEDTDDTYWDLCNSLVEAKTSGVLSQSCHIMFWFPMDKYPDTVEFFRTRDFRVDSYPLVWIKSDKMGIIPDPNRGPRRIYETALLMSLGDRKIIRPTVNGAWADSERRSDSHHVSTKPAVMLSDFFRMFIDGDSIVLDPTCGSGTAIKVALQMHCKFALGLDNDAASVGIATEVAEAAYNLRLRGA